MERDEVKLKILGPHGSIDVRALHRSLGGLIELLKATAAEEWVISDLRAASASLSVKPAVEGTIDFNRLFDEITQGLEQLAQMPGTPPAWTGEMLESLAAIGAPRTYDGVEGIEIYLGGRAPIQLSQVLVENISRTLKISNTSIGSVRGVIDRFLSRDGKNEFGLKDETTGKSIRVTFPRKLEARVVQAIRREVVAWGEIRRDSSGRKVALKLDDFEIVESSPVRPGIRDMIGILGDDWTGGANSVDWVRGQRDGE